MNASEQEKVKFTFTEKFKTRAFELLDEAHAICRRVAAQQRGSRRLRS
jgi:hypothetical protein